MGPRDTALSDVNVLLGRHPRTGAGVTTAEALIARLDRLGIAEALVGHMASWLHDPAAGNRRLVDDITGVSRLRPVWVVVPGHTGETPPAEQIVADAREHGVAAFRAYPADHGWSLTGNDASAAWRVIAAAGMPLLVDADQTSWNEIEECAGRHPDLRLVVCHTGYRTLRRISGILAGTASVMVDISYLSTHQGIEWLVERFSADRLVFGTGAPVRDPAEAVCRLMWSGLDDTAVAAIGSGNLHRLLQDVTV